MDPRQHSYVESEAFSSLSSPRRSLKRNLQAFDGLQQVQGQIQKNINTWAQLNQSFHKKQEQSFLITFNQIMQRMAVELASAQEKYQNIDLQVRKDERCQRLQKEVHFFRQQCLVLRDQVQSLKKELISIRTKNQGLKEESLVLKKKLQKGLDITTLDRSQGERTKNQSTTNKSFYLTEKQKVDEQTIALDGLIANLKSHDPRDGVHLLKSFIKNQVRDKQVFMEKKTMKSTSLAKQPVFHPSLMDTAEVIPPKNEFLDLWSECVREFKINKKLTKQIPKQSKFKLLQSFLSSQKFIELLRRKIFGQKCCTNWNCLGNLQQGPRCEQPPSPEKRTIQTADRAFRTSKYSRHATGSNKNKIFRVQNYSVWT